MGWSWTFYEIGIFTLSINIVSQKKNEGLNLRKKFCHHLMPIFLYIFAIKVALPPQRFRRLCCVSASCIALNTGKTQGQVFNLFQRWLTNKNKFFCSEGE